MTTALLPGPAGQNRYFDFHGIGIAVKSYRFDLLETLHHRLRHFAVDGLPGTADLSFVFQSGTAQPPIEKPKEDSRRVYGIKPGDVVYNDAKKLFYIGLDEGFKALCQASDGLARIVMPAESAKLQWATHFLFDLCFYELLKRRGLHNIHAAGLGSGGQGLLITGVSGAGKSTLCLALLRAGFDLLGDDTLFLTQGKEGVSALAFPDEIDVTGQTLGFFSELSDFSNAPKNHRKKTQIAAERIYQTGWLESCMPRVLLFPRVANTPTSILKPIGPEQALMELAPNIMLTDARSSQAHLDALGGLIRQCKCFRLETGLDFDTLPERLRDLL